MEEKDVKYELGIDMNNLPKELIKSYADLMHQIDNLNLKIDNTINTPVSHSIYKLTKERGYFIYWLMMHFAFLEDKGFDSQYKDISNNIPAWGRAIITDGKYTEYDRAFLKEVTEWLPNSDWVYKKPVLNEYNDYHTILESLQSN
jgi:hypothetical protein